MVWGSSFRDHGRRPWKACKKYEEGKEGGNMMVLTKGKERQNEERKGEERRKGTGS
jgi:hypothetical protein